ncbi:TPA: hypothetical protein DDY55_00010 [Candidatus Falkowbacteria bacterium]|nr:hypothetical protein [Candidatus Falkowbacteria bacterium]HAY12669.1 hypothetical protein [Candidatus Falkowbacteria bacterium]HBI96492.1 hypothetical protein [Candidatus Falkowbacteria bacterium]HBT27004.1 hypothetical protein [Candidatus Falkowbacteria bacterium]HBY14780.1 hypothetical protein [Candidatus Falkowbacteria bacterium]
MSLGYFVEHLVVSEVLFYFDCIIAQMRTIKIKQNLGERNPCTLLFFLWSECVRESLNQCGFL